MMSEAIFNIASEYGLTGFVILIFYLLMRNELTHLRKEISKLSRAVNRLRNELRAYRRT